MSTNKADDRGTAELRLAGEFDASKWAGEFMRMWGHRLNEVDGDLMLAWFANAIMAGYDHKARMLDADQRRLVEMAVKAGWNAGWSVATSTDPAEEVSSIATRVLAEWESEGR